MGHDSAPDRGRALATKAKKKPRKKRTSASAWEAELSAWRKLHPADALLWCLLLLWPLSRDWTGDLITWEQSLTFFAFCVIATAFASLSSSRTFVTWIVVLVLAAKAVFGLQYLIPWLRGFLGPTEMDAGLLDEQIAAAWQQVRILVSAILILAVALFAGEVVKQNAPIYRALAANDAAKPWKVLLESAYRWLVLAVIVAVSLVGQYLVARQLDRLVYAIAPFERYCEVRGIKPATYLPCARGQRSLDTKELVKLRRVDALYDQVDGHYAEQRRRLMIELSDYEKPIAPPHLNYVVPYWAERWVAELKPTGLLLASPKPAPPPPPPPPAPAPLRPHFPDLRDILHGLGGFGRGQRLPLSTAVPVPDRPSILQAMETELTASAAVIETQSAEFVAAVAKLSAMPAPDSAPVGTEDILDKVEQKMAAERQKFEYETQLSVTRMAARRLAYSSQEQIKQALDKSVTADRTVGEIAVFAAQIGAKPVCRFLAKAGDAAEEPREFRIPCDGIGQVPLPLRDVGVMESARLSFAKAQAIEMDKIDKMVGAKDLAARSEVADAREKADQFEDETAKSIDLGRDDCKWVYPPRWANCIKNMGKKRAESTYAGLRAQLGREYREKTGQAHNDAKVLSDIALDRLSDELTSALATTRAELDNEFERGRRWWQSFSMMLTAIFLYVVIYSFLYTLALAVYGYEDAMDFSLRKTGSVGSYSSAAKQILDPEFETSVASKQGLNNQRTRRAWAPPWPLASVLHRLRHRSYFGMIIGTHPDEKDDSEEIPVSLGISKDQYPVQWTVKPGEVVTFRYKYFYGASTNMQLSTQTCLQLWTVLLGWFRFPVAQCKPGTGPGRLFFRVNGQAQKNADVGLFHAYRLAAWNANALFRTYNFEDFKGYLLDGVGLKRDFDKPSNVLVDPGSSSGGITTGLWRFVGRLFSPFF